MPTLAGINGGSLTADLSGGIRSGLVNRRLLDQNKTMREDREAKLNKQGQLASLLGQAYPANADEGPMMRPGDARGQLEAQFPQEAAQIAQAQAANFKNASAVDQERVRSVVQGAAEIQGLPVEQQVAKLQARKQRLIASGKPTNDTDEHLNLLMSGRIDEANALTDQSVDMGGRLGLLETEGGELSAGQREFASLSEGLSDEDKDTARRIELGLLPRAVGSAVQTISDKGIEDRIGEVESVIAQRKKFGEQTGLSRAQTIDSSFVKINKIDQGVRNINRAIAAIEGGAGTGAIQRYLPSIRASSVALDNIQKSMALDVIGAVTFGALSQGELNLAKEVALPTGLDDKQLMQHLAEKKDAQIKLRDYFKDQIDFLDQGGTVAGFLRDQERSITSNEPQSPAQNQDGGEDLPEGTFIKNPQTGQRMQVVNGELVEVQ